MEFPGNVELSEYNGVDQMLVLSRKESDKILFPSLGITVEVLRVQGNRTRLGIEAPSDVPILRHEIAALKSIEFTPDKRTVSVRLKDLVYAIRHRLDTAAVQLNDLHARLEGTTDATVQPLIESLFSELRMLEREANQVLEESGEKINGTPQALLVEDSATERQLLEAYFDVCGFNVTTARDGKEALDYLSMHARPDIVLLDMMMPRVDGPEFLRIVRSDPKQKGLPIFALTGMEREQFAIPTGPAGVERWYVKPVDPKALIADIAEYVAQTPAIVT